MINNDTYWQFRTIFELAVKHKVAPFCVTGELLKHFGDRNILEITADMLEYIDEELAMQQGDSAGAHAGLRSVRN